MTRTWPSAAGSSASRVAGALQPRTTATTLCLTPASTTSSMKTWRSSRAAGGHSQHQARLPVQPAEEHDQPERQCAVSAYIPRPPIPVPVHTTVGQPTARHWQPEEGTDPAAARTARRICRTSPPSCPSLQPTTTTRSSFRMPGLCGHGLTLDLGLRIEKEYYQLPEVIRT